MPLPRWLAAGETSRKKGPIRSFPGSKHACEGVETSIFSSKNSVCHLRDELKGGKWKSERGTVPKICLKVVLMVVELRGECPQVVLVEQLGIFVDPPAPSQKHARKKEGCVRALHRLWESCQGVLIDFEAASGTRGLTSPSPPVWLKKTGVHSSWVISRYTVADFEFSHGVEGARCNVRNAHYYYAVIPATQH